MNPNKAEIYYDGKLIHTVIGYAYETEQELWYRVRNLVLVVVPPAKEKQVMK
jgi:hypothetical protein